MTTEYNTTISNSTREAAPQLLEGRAIPIGMKLAKEIGFIAAIILQHFYYLLLEGYGNYVTSDGNRWMHHPRWEWVANHFPGLSEWQYRQGRERLRQLGLLKTCQPRAKEWDHTNYHTLDYEALKALILSIGESPPIDWRHPTNRLVSTHQSNKETKQTSKQTSKTAAAADEKVADRKPAEIPATQPENQVRETRQKRDPQIKPKIPDSDQSSAAPRSPMEKEKIDVVADAGIAINPQLARELMEHSLDVVEEACRYYIKIKGQKGKPTNPGGWLVSCLRAHWWLDAVDEYEQEFRHPASQVYTAADFEVPDQSPPPAEFLEKIKVLTQKSSKNGGSRLKL